MRNFIAISTEVINARFAFIGTSVAGRYLHAPERRDLTSLECLDFLYSLHTLAKSKRYARPSFVWYAASRDVELLLRDLPADAKDIAFPSPTVRAAKKTLRDNLTRLRREYKDLPADATKTQRRLLEQDIHTQKAELHALEYIYFNGYRLKVKQGKTLTIYKLSENGKAHKGLTVYDIAPFFNGGSKDLPTVATRYLGYAPPLLNRTVGEVLPLWETAETQEQAVAAVKDYIAAETDIIVKLARKLDGYFTDAGIKLTKWYGASAATNYLLSKWQARREFWRMTEENTPRPLFQAVNSAFYGGRIETLKLGTLESVYVYDINTAYAYAASLLPKLSKRWHYTRDYNLHELFALWRVEYDLPASAYIGILPHRTITGSTVYRKRGRGWYYSPEVRELARRYPDSFKVTEGYVLPYSRVTFGAEIEALYEHRLMLQRAGQPSEKIFKLVLASIYGKFAQTKGQAHYHCLAWAGWITSFVRAMLLEVLAGQERNVICFAQDAIHTTRPLEKAIVGDGLGEWKLKQAARGLYLQSGVYKLYGDEEKTATRGFEVIDFERAARDLNNGWSTKISRDSFVGWRLARMPNLDYRNSYLERISENFNLEPRAAKHRQFSLDRRIDWRTEFVDSEMLRHGDGRESAPRREQDYTRRLDMMIDVIEARRS